MGQEVCEGEAGGDPRGTGCGSAFLFAATDDDDVPARSGNLRIASPCLSHCFAAIGESVFFLFYNVIYCHVMFSF